MLWDCCIAVGFAAGLLRASCGGIAVMVLLWCGSTVGMLWDCGGGTAVL